jgi:hypothetical protein
MKCAAPHRCGEAAHAVLTILPFWFRSGHCRRKNCHFETAKPGQANNMKFKTAKLIGS